MSAESHTPKASHKRKRIPSAAPAETEPQSAKRIRSGDSGAEATKPGSMAADSIYDIIVTIRIGESSENFYVHRGLLCQASSFFMQELTSSETIATDDDAHTIIMKDEDLETFRRFKNWLYSNQIITGSETYKDFTWSQIISVYAFAERRGIPRLQNHCIDTIIKKRREGGLFPGQVDVGNLWRLSGNVFRLRRLLLDMFSRQCNLTNAIANNGSYHAKFLQGLVQTLYQMKVEKSTDDGVDFWARRHQYYVEDAENPLMLD